MCRASLSSVGRNTPAQSYEMEQQRWGLQGWGLRKPDSFCGNYVALQVNGFIIVCFCGHSVFAVSRDPTRIDECLFASEAGPAKCTRSVVSLCGNPECGVTFSSPVPAKRLDVVTCPMCKFETKLPVMRARKVACEARSEQGKKV